MDVFVGLVSETHVADSLVGPTLACLLGSQFEDIKFGDRFFYETRAQEEGFTDGRVVVFPFLTLVITTVLFPVFFIVLNSIIMIITTGRLSSFCCPFSSSPSSRQQ